jgi:hypothetical protein
MKETLKKAGYTYIRYLGNKLHLLKLGNNYEIFAANKNHTSWGLIYKNTHLEFCCRAYYSDN